MISACPTCSSKNIRFSQPRTILEKIGGVVGYCVFRCRDCGLRFSDGFAMLPGFHARCPECYRQELTDWSEPYYYPPKYMRALLYIGAKAHRCSKCRVNFVSFRPRKKLQFEAPAAARRQEPSPRPKRNVSPQPAANAERYRPTKDDHLEEPEPTRN